MEDVRGDRSWGWAGASVLFVLAAGIALGAAALVRDLAEWGDTMARLRAAE
jgi:hypothetical protein